MSGSSAASYSTIIKAASWTMKAFCHILDVSRVNAQTLWPLNNNKPPSNSDSFEFGYELAMQLTHDNILEQNTLYLSQLTKIKIDHFLGKTGGPARSGEPGLNNSRDIQTSTDGSVSQVIKFVPVISRNCGKRRRCKDCYKQLTGSDRRAKGSVC